MNRPLIVGIAGAIIVLGAIALTFFIDREPDRPVQQGATSLCGDIACVIIFSLVIVRVIIFLVLFCAFIDIEVHACCGKWTT